LAHGLRRAGSKDFFLDEFFEDLLGDFVILHVGDFHAKFAAQRSRRRSGGVVEPLRVDFPRRGHVGSATPRALEVDRPRRLPGRVGVRDLKPAAELFRQGADHVLDQIGHDA
jgi:hypothetical protein